LQEAITLFESLPDSANKVYAAIDLAELEQLVSASNSFTLAWATKTKRFAAEDLIASSLKALKILPESFYEVNWVILQSAARITIKP